MIPAIVLAAGKSTRMGRSKALLPLGAGETFATRLVATLRAAGVDDVIVVVGHDAPAVVSALERAGANARIVVNTEYEAGQLSSLVAGLRAVDRPGVVAALMTLVDVPLVHASTVRAVLARYHGTHAKIVRPVSGDRHGHPVLIDRAVFDELYDLYGSNPEHGAKDVIRAHASSAGDVVVDDEGAFEDADTPREYDALLARLDGKNVPPRS